MEAEQRLLAEILDRFAQQFDRRAVLRGGMVLRVLGSPRMTNDLDYVFVPYRSKKEIEQEVIACLESIDGVQVRHSLNSKCLRAVVTRGRINVQVEAKVSRDMQTITASTRLFSRQFDLPQRLIPVVDPEIALANKLAAWNERRLLRDIYDIWFYLQMNARPDRETLEQRLRKPDYSKLVKKEDYFPGTGCSEFYEFIRKHTASKTDEDIANELSDYLPREELKGLAVLFRAALTKLT